VDGDYNVQVNGNRVSIMSKELDRYDGEYAGITKLDKQSAMLLKKEICSLINDGSYNEWYENALVQMILSADFKLYHYDISDYEWHELDTVNDLLYAKELIHKESKES
jgi:choline kinase